MGNNSNHSTSKETQARQKRERLGKEKLNKQGCLMRIIEYNKSSDMVVEFQDKRKTKVKTTYNEFTKGSIKNPYYPTIYGVGCIGTKYHARTSKKYLKNMLLGKICCLDVMANHMEKDIKRIGMQQFVRNGCVMKTFMIGYTNNQTQKIF